MRLALVDEHTGPALIAAQNRRGLIAYVAARTVDRVPRGLGRTPGGCLLVIPGALPNRRAVIEVAGCQGYVGARTGSAALMAAVGAPDERAPATSARSAAPRPPCAARSPTPARRSPHVLRPSGPLLPLAYARGVTFMALAAFGALHWMAMLEPSAPGRAWDALGAALLAMVGLLLRRPPDAAPRAWAAVAVISLLAILLAFLAGGISAELLRPANWDELAAGIQRGIGDLPGARVPYRGIDQWIRLVIPLGGTVLVVARGAHRVLAAAQRAPASRSPRS